MVEMWGCDPIITNRPEKVAPILRKAAKAAKADPVHASYRRFQPQGVSGVLVVQESHLSVHTWPEVGYVAVDIYTCGRCFPDRAVPVLYAGFKATSKQVMEVTRGLPHGLEVASVEPRIAPESPAEGEPAF